MRKLDIARRIHQETGISEEEAAALLEWVLSLLKTTLQKGEPITIQGFGKLTVRNKLARKGRNPHTGEALMIPARQVVTFRPSLLLRTAVARIE